MKLLQRKIQNHPQQRSRNLISVVEMVEAMFERSPNYFKQFQKQFKFLIADEKPNLTASNNYAVCPHFESEFCQLPTNHFHVLIESAIDVETMKPIKIFAVPVSSLPSDTYFQPQRVWNLKEIHFQNYSLPLTLITNLERKWIQRMYASDFHPWQQRQPNYHKSTAVTSGISKTLARSTSIVPQKTIHNFENSN